MAVEKRAQASRTGAGRVGAPAGDPQQDCRGVSDRRGRGDVREGVGYRSPGSRKQARRFRLHRHRGTSGVSVDDPGNLRAVSDVRQDNHLPVGLLGRNLGQKPDHQEVHSFKCARQGAGRPHRDQQVRFRTDHRQGGGDRSTRRREPGYRLQRDRQGFDGVHCSSYRPDPARAVGQRH